MIDRAGKPAAPRPGAWILPVGFALLCGCASSPETSRGEDQRVAIPSEAPDDFTLSVTVRVPEPGVSSWTAYSLAYTPGRYIVEPSGSLRVGVGSGVDERTFPPAVRELIRDDLHAIWGDLAGCGVLGRGGPRADFDRVVSHPVALVEARWNGQWDKAVIVLTDQDPRSSAARGLVERLGALAWMQ